MDAGIGDWNPQGQPGANEPNPRKPAPGQRVVSLLPSITEIVCGVGGGLEDQLVGVTHECDTPADVVARCEVVTTSGISPHTMSQAEIDRRVKGSLAMGHSLYGLDEAALLRADPTIVFTQALCDVCAPAFPMVLQRCVKVLGEDPRVISIEPQNVQDVIDSVRLVGKETGFTDSAEAKAKQLEEGFARIRKGTKEAVEAGSPPKKVAFLEWLEPLFNGGHWIPDMMEDAGANYSMVATGERSAEIDPASLSEYDPDMILVAPCGFDQERAFKDAQRMWAHAWWKDLRAVREGQVYALDGNAYYARPGPRLLEGCGIIARLVHGDEVCDRIGQDVCPRDEWARVTPPAPESG